LYYLPQNFKKRYACVCDGKRKKYATFVRNIVEMHPYGRVNESVMPINFKKLRWNVLVQERIKFQVLMLEV
jgi:hypothetical protein